MTGPGGRAVHGPREASGEIARGHEVVWACVGRVEMRRDREADRAGELPEM